jgi:hypothetical protein
VRQFVDFRHQVWKTFIGGFALLFIFVMGLLSGHRAFLCYFLMVFFFMGLFQDFFTLRRIVLSALIGLCALFLVYIVTPSMPLSFQRSVSVLPGIRTNIIAKQDALNTLNGRILSIQLGLQDLSKYWVLGRGFTFKKEDLEYTRHLSVGERTHKTGQYYNGTIGSLITTGIPGSLLMMAYILILSREAIRLQRAAKQNLTLHQGFIHLCQISASLWFTHVLYFYLLHGNAATWANSFLMPSGMILLCSRTLKTSTSLEVEKVSGEGVSPSTDE